MPDHQRIKNGRKDQEGQPGPDHYPVLSRNSYPGPVMPALVTLMLYLVVFYDHFVTFRESKRK